MLAWLRHFAAGKRFEVLAVESHGQWVAALPLVSRRLKGILPVACLPQNEWSCNGDLLVDPQCDLQTVLDRLVGLAARRHWPLLWLDGIATESPWWQAMIAALGRAGLPLALTPQYEVGTIAIDGNWDAYYGQLSGSFKRNLRRRTKALSEHGPLTLQPVALSSLPASEVRQQLRHALLVEDRSWKGPQGTSVLKSPGMFDFFCQQCQALADHDQVGLYRLDLNGAPIAFELGYRAKGVWFAHKISYDESYAREAPGHLLRLQMLPRLFAEGFRLYDYFGPYTDAVARWATGRYGIGRLVVAPRRPLSRFLLRLYREHLRRRSDRAQRPTSQALEGQPRELEVHDGLAPQPLDVAV
jgi:CelD/BcsL family acetyltransferase involved in cellulose biosynthesis